ncbi:hypothetical protein PCE1_000132 [Barthelona sp. PCE]
MSEEFPPLIARKERLTIEEIEKLEGLPEIDTFQNVKPSELCYCTYRQAPDFLKGNSGICDYYRFNYSHSMALRSIFKWHNQTLNLWTHLLGALLMFFCYQWWAVDEYSVVFKFITIGPAITQFFSGVFHMFGCCSKNHYFRLVSIDIASIAATVFPLQYGNARLLLPGNAGDTWIKVCFTANAIGILTVFVPSFNDPNIRWVRSVVWSTIAFCAFIIPVDSWRRYGRSDILEIVFIQYIFWFIAMLIYSFRIPERSLVKKYAEMEGIDDVVKFPSTKTNVSVTRTDEKKKHRYFSTFVHSHILFHLMITFNSVLNVYIMNYIIRYKLPIKV